MTPTKQMIERLKSCPFCGAKAEAYIAFPHSCTPWRVGVDHGDICPMRITDGHCYKTQAEATAAWNTRATIETLTPSAAGEGVERHTFNSYERPVDAMMRGQPSDQQLTASPPNQPHPDIEGRARELEDARVYLGPFLERHGLGGNLLGHEAGRLYDAAIEALAALTLPCAEIRREAE